MSAPVIIGVTGRIAAGKSEASSFLAKRFGCMLFDADKEAKYLSAEPEVTAKIIETFPQAKDGNGGLCRLTLRDTVFADAAGREKLENLLYPALKEEARDFVKQARSRGKHGVIDAPLLSRAGLDALCDRIFLIEAPLETREARALKRPSMTREAFAAVNSAQHDITPGAESAGLIRIDGGASIDAFRSALEKAMAQTMGHF